MNTKLGRFLEAAAGLALIALAVAWLSGAFEERVAPGVVELPPGGPVDETAVVQVKAITGPVLERASGTVASARQTSVASRVLARIEEIRVRAGDEVERNDILVRLDARDVEARASQAREALRGAEAQRDLAVIEKNRFTELVKTGAGTQRRVDEVTSGLRVAEAEVERLTRGLEEAETALSYTLIAAPVTGRVIDRLAEPGETASPGRTLLRIYDPSVLRIEAPVRESLAVHLAVGDILQSEIPSLDLKVDGTIDEIVPFAEAGARTLLIKVRLPPDPRVLAGMFARIAVPAGERTRLLVPVNAIEHIGQLLYASVVTSDGRIARRLVTIGLTDAEGRTEVLSGLAAEDRILVAGLAGSTLP